MVQCVPLTFSLKLQLFRMTFLHLAALGTAWKGRLGNLSPPSDYIARGTSPLHTCRAGVSFLLLTPTLLALRDPFFFAMLLFKPDQCNAPFHRAAQEVICGHKWEAADLGLDGQRRMDVTHLALGRHQSPSHTTSLHQNLPLI